MRRRPLERRLRLATFAFGAVLAATFAVLLPQVAWKTEDVVFRKQTARMLAIIATDPPAALIPGMRIVRPDDATPAWLRRRIADLPPGVHELNDVPLDPADLETDLFVGVAMTTAGRHELVYDVRQFEAFDEAIAAPGYDLLIAIGLFIAVSGSVVTWWQLQHVFRSLQRLALLSQNTDPAARSALLSRFGKDEIGDLAFELLEARAQLVGALDRERRFTREASHELRTPVAIISGALELLRRDGQLAPVAVPLVARIAAANHRIEALITAFLWLARGPMRHEDMQTLTAAPLLHRVLAELRQAGIAADEVVLDVVRDPTFDGDPLCVEVVLRNLVDNALRHREPGPVRIRIDGELSIRNATSTPRGATSGGHGIGIGIVHDLCQRFGWQVGTTVTDGEHVAAIRFASADRCAARVEIDRSECSHSLDERPPSL